MPDHREAPTLSEPSVEIARLHREVYRTAPRTSVALHGGVVHVSTPTNERFIVTDEPDWDAIDAGLEISGKLHLYAGQFLTLLPHDHLPVQQVYKSFFRWVTSPIMRERWTTFWSWDHATAWRMETAWMLLESADPELAALLGDSLRIDIEWTLHPGHIRLNNHGLFLVRSLLFTLPHLVGDFAGLRQQVSTAVTQNLGAILDLVYGDDNWCGENSPLYDRVWINLLTELRGSFSPQLADLGESDRIGKILHDSDITSRAQLLPNRRYVPRGDTPRRDTGHTPVRGTHWSERVGIWTFSHGDLYLMGTAGMASATHKHVDETQVFLNWRGVDFFLDGGMHSYNYADPRIPTLRTAIGHSVLDGDGLRALPPWDAYHADRQRITGALSEPTERSVTLTKKFDDIAFRRHVSVAEDGASISYDDSVQSPHPIRMVARFLLAGNATVRTTSERIDVYRLGKHLSIEVPPGTVVNVVEAEKAAPYRGWYSTSFKELLPGKMLEVRPADTSRESVLSYTVQLDPRDVEEPPSTPLDLARQSDQVAKRIPLPARVAVTGTGPDSLLAGALLSVNNRLECFVDTSEQLVGTSIWGIPIQAAPLAGTAVIDPAQMDSMHPYDGDRGSDAAQLWARIVETVSAVDLHRASHLLYSQGLTSHSLLLDDTLFRRFNCKIPGSAIIGKNFSLGYGGIGVVIHASSVIGDNVTIAQNVTLEGRNRRLGPPRVGDNVYFGANSTFLGGSIGSGSVVGAGSVVLEPVDENSVVAGNPARLIRGTTTPPPSTTTPPASRKE